MLVATSVLITRIWAIYELKRWVLVTLCALVIAVLVPSIVIIQWQAKLCELAPNPAPEIISGCRFNSTPLSVVSYIAPFLLDTILFVMTVYKVFRSNPTPLMARLMQDGALYYAAVMGTFLFVGFSTLAPATSTAINGSGLFVAVLSSMCTRLILSTRSYYDPSTLLSSLETSSVAGNLHFTRGEWRVQRVPMSQQVTVSRLSTRDFQDA
ncbi:hypothetical protein FS749_001050 [Ceratobasidium sp. UAMH 11750]|nr:hypothetical protein FS749_001050 [Ceratobasidium sp. UAMH 11750]